MNNQLLLFAIITFSCFHYATPIQRQLTVPGEKRPFGAGNGGDLMECFRLEGESCQDPVLGLAGQCPCDLSLRCVYNVCVPVHTNNEDPASVEGDYKQASVGEFNLDQPNLYYDE